MRFVNRPTIDSNSNTEQFFFDSTNNVLGVTGQVALYKNETESIRTFLKSSSALSSEYTLTLPPNSGSAGQVLTTDGNGTLTFSNPDVGGNRIFVSAKNGDDTNDGFIKPVKSIKKAAQIAASFSVPTYDPGTQATNAQTLLRANKNFIAAEVIGYIADTYPSLTYTIATCIRDIGYMIEAVIYDLMNGGNTQSIYSGNSYFGGTATAVIANQRTQSVAAINYAKYVAAAVLSNTTLTTSGTYTRAPYQRYRTDNPLVTYTQTKDVTKTTVTSNITGTIASTATTTTITGIADVSNLCIGMTLTKVSGTGAFGGVTVITNVNYVTKIVTIKSTTSNTAGSLTFTASAAGAISNSFDIISGILTNGLNTGPTTVNPLYTPLPVTIVIATGDYTEDNPIIMSDKTTLIGDDLRSVIIRPKNQNKDIFRLRTGMYMTGFTFRDQLDTDITSAGYGKPKFTWNYAVAFDDVTDYTIDRGGYIGLAASIPVVNLSPYIQNCSIISFLGGNGALVDGSKVASPNTPRIADEVEFPPVGPTPTQGKSMVANAFTMVSFGGTGWKVINEAYVQLVSCFQIFLLNGVWCQSGGYASITNSATNFGINALRSSGYSANIFSFDKALIADVGEDVSNLQAITSLGHGRIPVNHYILKFKSKTDLSDITSNYKNTTQVTKTFNAASAITLNVISITGHGFTTGMSVYYINPTPLVNSDVPGLTSGDSYYVNKLSNNTLSLYYDNSFTKIVSISAGTGANHTLQQNTDEFFVQEITDYHNQYQTLTIGGAGVYFNPGYTIAGTVGSAINAASVYSWTCQLTLSGNVNLSAGAVVVQAVTGAFGTVVNLVTNSNTITLTSISGAFDIVSSHTLSSGTGLGVYPTAIVGTLVVSISKSTNNTVTARTSFDITASPNKINADHSSPSPVTNISITALANRSDLYTGVYTVKSVYGNRMGGTSSTSTLQGNYVWLYKPSIVNSSGHTWEYAGSGIDYNALPDNGGRTIIAYQQVEEVPGRVYTSGTNELGDFTVGNFITAYNRTGNIVFTNKVTVSELSALKLSLSDVSITAISTDVGLGDNETGGASDGRLTTQRAQRLFLANRLGDFIDRHVSTNSVPSSIVQLNSNGQINADLIPATRTISTHLVSTYGGRLTLYEKIPVDEVVGGDVVSETYALYELTLNTTISVLAGHIVTQATSGAYGTVQANVASSTSLKLANIVGTFDTSANHYLLTDTTNSTALNAYPTAIGSAVQTSDSYYLTKDNTSQFLQLQTTSNYRFTIGNSVTAALSGSTATISDYRCGFITNVDNAALVTTGGSGYTTGGSYYNKPLTGGTGKYTSAAGATSVTTTITVTSTTSLEIGMLVTVTAGTGAFQASTTVTGITDSTHFTVSKTPSTPLSGGATVVRGDATGAYADITVSSGKVTAVNMYRGGVGYQVGDVLSVSDANIGGRTGGAAFSIAVTSIEKRLYVDITNGVKFIASSTSSNYIEDNNASSFNITIDPLVNFTRSFNAASIDNGGAVNYITNVITISGTNTITAVASGTTVTLGSAASYTAGTTITTGASLAVGSSGLAINTTYYVAATTSSSTSVTLSLTYGGSAITFVSTSFSTNNTVTVGHGFIDKDPVNYTIANGSTAIGGSGAGVYLSGTFYIGYLTTTTFSLYYDYAKTTIVNFGTSGYGTSYLTRYGLDIVSNTFYKLAHGLSPGIPIKISNFTGGVPTATIGGTTAPISSGSFWFVGSVTTNSFTLHQYKVDAASSISGTTNNPLQIITAGTSGQNGTATFTLENVTIVGQVNTSSKTSSNFSSLSTTTIDASAIISGIISPSRLGSSTASSSTYLRGDSSWHTALESVSQAPNSAITLSGSGLSTPAVTIPDAQATISSISVATPWTATLTLSAGSTAQYFAGMTLTKSSGTPGAFGSGTTTILSITGTFTMIIGGSTTAPTAGLLTFSATATVNQYTGNPTIDVAKVDSSATGAAPYSNIGVASFDTTYFTIGSKSTAGQVTITPQTIDAKLLLGFDRAYYLNSDNHTTQAPGKGGTGQTTYTTGDILYADGAASITKLSLTSKAGYVLTVNTAATAPNWTGFTGSSGSSIVYNENPSFKGSIATSTVSFDLINTTATTVNFAGAGETLNVGYIGSATSATFSQNYSTGYVGSGATKTVNIGTGGVANSKTNINIGNTNGGTTTINSSLTIGSSLTATVVTTAITSTPAVAIDSWALATYRSAKYILQVTCTAVSSGSNLNTYQVSEVLVIHNGTTATMIEYGAIKTTNDLATFTVDCNTSSNGLVRLLAVAANASDTITVKLYKTLMVV